MKSRLPEHLNLLPGPQIPVLVQGLLQQDGPNHTKVHYKGGGVRHGGAHAGQAHQPGPQPSTT